MENSFAKRFAMVVATNIALVLIFVPGSAAADVVKELWNAETHERKTDLETLIQSRPSQTIRVQVVFHGAVRTDQLAQSLEGSRLKLKKLSYREYPANAEYDVLDSDDPAAAFSKVKSARNAATRTLVDEANGRLVNGSSAEHDEGKRQLRAAAWAKEDFDKRGVRFLGMEVVGAASDIAKFYKANLFVNTVAWVQ